MTTTSYIHSSPPSFSPTLRRSQSFSAPIFRSLVSNHFSTAPFYSQRSIPEQPPRVCWIHEIHHFHIFSRTSRPHAERPSLFNRPSREFVFRINSLRFNLAEKIIDTIYALCRSSSFSLKGKPWENSDHAEARDRTLIPLEAPSASTLQAI